jgi:hypothetical protein
MMRDPGIGWRGRAIYALFVLSVVGAIAAMLW